MHESKRFDVRRLRLEALHFAEEIGFFEAFVNGFEPLRAFGMAGAVVV
jgi:hypothetical protein